MSPLFTALSTAISVFVGLTRAGRHMEAEYAGFQDEFFCALDVGLTGKLDLNLVGAQGLNRGFGDFKFVGPVHNVVQDQVLNVFFRQLPVFLKG